MREIVGEAEERLATSGRGTILFVDEIHRFNKAQQDAFLPHVERGTITLIGATTENPSFEINGALLSRVRVFVLEPLTRGGHRARSSTARSPTASVGSGALELTLDDGRARAARRRRRTATRGARSPCSRPRPRTSAQRARVTVEVVREALQLRFARYDKGGEEHYNMLCAFHKSLRGSDPQGALYWMARMIEGGEDPMMMFRRAIAMAAEDIGLADPKALKLAVAARDAYHMLGPPEGYLPLAEMIDLPRDGAEVERDQGRARRGAAAARETPGESGAAAHPERADATDEGTGVLHGVSVRARFRERVHPAGVPAGEGARRDVLRAGAVRLREGDREADGVVGSRRRERGGEREVDSAGDLRGGAWCVVFVLVLRTSAVAGVRDARPGGVQAAGGDAAATCSSERRRLRRAGRSTCLLKVYNPNDFASTRRTSRTRCSWTATVIGEASEPWTAVHASPAKDSSDVTLPVRFSWADRRRRRGRR